LPDLFLEVRDDDADAPAPSPLSEADAFEVLCTGSIVGQKLIPWGSNYSFAAAVEDDAGREVLAIYKPMRGENPLWDFEDGTLYEREVAAWRLSRLLGWRLIPPTVVHEGPMGPGSLQLYKTPSESMSDAELYAFWGQQRIEIERLVLFDYIANNADRKLSHCLLDIDGEIWGIDHGLCFNVDFKLRTVLWQFMGCPLSPELVQDLEALRSRETEICAELGSLLNEHEMTVLLRRIDAFLANPVFPVLNPARNVPYGWW
jgi:uncharacterized repeat protein (TIGR03843 family)